MTDFNDRLKALRKRKQELLDEQGRLITKIKTEHPKLYAWVLENGIDLTNLKAYSASIAAAFVVAINTVYGGAVQGYQTSVQQEVQIIETLELQGLKEEEKAQIVWERYGPLIERTAQKYNLDSRLIFATIMLESGGDTHAIRHEPQIGDASYGLGQILYGTALGLGFDGNPTDLYDPATNIELIGRYHRRNMDVYGANLSAEELTIAYNAGSPYASPHPGHIMKFQRWFNKLEGVTG